MADAFIDLEGLKLPLTSDEILAANSDFRYGVYYRKTAVTSAAHYATSMAATSMAATKGI